MKIYKALVCMEGSSLQWLQELQQRAPDLSWNQLKLELLQNYGGDGGNARGPKEHRVAVQHLDTFVEHADELVSRSDQVLDSSVSFNELFSKWVYVENHIQLEKGNAQSSLQLVFKVSQT